MTDKAKTQARNRRNARTLAVHTAAAATSASLALAVLLNAPQAF